MSFLVDALKTFQQEGWDLLHIQSLTDLAHCYEQLEDDEKLMRICAVLASAQRYVTTEEREMFFTKMVKSIETNGNKKQT